MCLHAYAEADADIYPYTYTCIYGHIFLARTYICRNQESSERNRTRTPRFFNVTIARTNISKRNLILATEKTSNFDESIFNKKIIFPNEACIYKLHLPESMRYSCFRNLSIDNGTTERDKYERKIKRK